MASVVRAWNLAEPSVGFARHERDAQFRSDKRTGDMRCDAPGLVMSGSFLRLHVARRWSIASDRCSIEGGSSRHTYEPCGILDKFSLSVSSQVSNGKPDINITRMFGLS
jgi:hypothetical protein